jgi:hypothetical protein
VALQLAKLIAGNFVLEWIVPTVQTLVVMAGKYLSGVMFLH